MTKKWWAIGGLVFLAFAAIAAGAAFVISEQTEVVRPPEQATLSISGSSHTATILRKEAELIRGLSGSQSLPEGRAMLFVFPTNSKWGIWMKDMNYPIDIVWLDSAAKVVHLVEDAQPESYPDTSFYPPVAMRYVIELPSGTIEKTGIQLGDKAALPSGV